MNRKTTKEFEPMDHFVLVQCAQHKTAVCPRPWCNGYPATKCEKMENCSQR